MYRFKLTYLTQLISIIALLSLALVAVGDDYDDFDLEFDFSSHQKSTIDDFPFEEIDSKELSNAAIAGALQASTTSQQTGKPVFMEKKEADDKKKESDVEVNDNSKSEDDIIRFSQFQPSTPNVQQPIFHQYESRIYSAHNVNMVERP